MSTSRTQLIELHPGIKINTITTHPSHPPLLQHDLPTIVFLHFYGGSTRTWSHVIPPIATKYPTVAIDFRGWGDSTGPDNAAAYSIKDLAADVHAVISALQLTSVVLVGLSMGAKVAQLVAAQWGSSASHSSGGEEPGVLCGVVLVSPAPTTPLILPPEMREQSLHAYETRESATFVAKNVLTSSFRSRELPDFIVDDMLRGNRWAREAWPAYAMKEDVSTAVAGKITMPVLVLAAEEDVVETLERVRNEVCARILDVQLEILTESGHLSPLDVPGAVVEQVLRFIEQL
ncbi:Nn.00g066290.m01.CDS01 [Neocucurbitaria sp. VM-36]